MTRIYILFVLNHWPIGVAVSKDNLADVLLPDSQTDSSSSGTLVEKDDLADVGQKEYPTSPSGESGVYSRMGYIY